MISNKYWVYYYYYIAIFVSFLYLFIPQIRIGVTCSCIMVVLYALHFFKFGENLRYGTVFDILVVLYMLYNCISIFLGDTRTGYSISIGISEYSNAILPCCFFFIARASESKVKGIYYKSFTISILFTYAVGLLFYIFKPAIYTSYMSRTIVNFYMETYNLLPRMHSFLGSVSVGLLGCIALGILLFNRVNIPFKAIAAIMLTVGIVLTKQRASWICMLIIWMFFILYYYITKKTKKIVPITLAVLFVILIIGGYKYSAIIQQVDNLINSRGGLSLYAAFSERNQNFSAVFNDGFSSVVGHGLGSAGHRMMGNSTFLILDGYFFKLIYEIGIIGSSILIVILIASIIISINKRMWHALVILSSCIIVALGSSCIAFQLVAPILWFCIGDILGQSSVSKKSLQIL